MKLLSTVSGKDMTNFMEQWVCSNGVPHLLASYNFIRKKNFIELKLRQEVPQQSSKFVVSSWHHSTIVSLTHSSLLYLTLFSPLSHTIFFPLSHILSLSPLSHTLSYTLSPHSLSLTLSTLTITPGEQFVCCFVSRCFYLHKWFPLPPFYLEQVSLPVHWEQLPF